MWSLRDIVPTYSDECPEGPLSATLATGKRAWGLDNAVRSGGVWWSHAADSSVCAASGSGFSTGGLWFYNPSLC